MPLSISKEELNELPLLQFEGKVVIINSQTALEHAVNELLKEEILGFDTEARPSFKKGEYHPTSLVQISTDDKCFLIRSLATGLTDPLINLLENEEVLKIGIALHDDLIDLRKARNFRPKGFVDLNKMAESLGMEDVGAKKLSGIFLRGRISKNQQTSNWENPVLTEAQQMYAATDAWVCLKIYEKMITLDPDVI